MTIPSEEEDFNPNEYFDEKLEATDGLALFDVLCTNLACGNAGYVLRILTVPDDPRVVCGGEVRDQVTGELIEMCGHTLLATPVS